ncbi:hypothetical protein PPERSA_11768 [Pseudocohnilembus persalinus]|uniref:Uncharacterized protein n=1 Tax=Pseudocohnilembus persalinus TaxID=266149 RepID=A0A0V0QGI6_PSEPJ|nr:hypothetical protein PPERSA_11768 [Pseudocohnilembus persalinus]|eukprot:KRX01321.1 hypothetical protein PPERSA_11768 [Pseudocohnilembus persalinus]
MQDSQFKKQYALKQMKQNFDYNDFSRPQQQIEGQFKSMENSKKSYLSSNDNMTQNNSKIYSNLNTSNLNDFTNKQMSVNGSNFKMAFSQNPKKYLISNFSKIQSQSNFNNIKHQHSNSENIQFSQQYNTPKIGKEYLLNSQNNQKSSHQRNSLQMDKLNLKKLIRRASKQQQLQQQQQQLQQQSGLYHLQNEQNIQNQKNMQTFTEFTEEKSVDPRKTDKMKRIYSEQQFIKPAILQSQIKQKDNDQSLLNETISMNEVDDFISYNNNNNNQITKANFPKVASPTKGHELFTEKSVHDTLFFENQEQYFKITNQDSCNIKNVSQDIQELKIAYIQPNLKLKNYPRYKFNFQIEKMDNPTNLGLGLNYAKKFKQYQQQ